VNSTLVAGVDSSTQSCKVVVVDATSGATVRTGAAAHPPGTEVAPRAWWNALHLAVTAAGGIDDVAAVSVAGQQHGMVCLDADGAVVRDALLWNDLRSADATTALTSELAGGKTAWATAVGSALVPSLTITKLRWLAEHEPGRLARTAAVCLPHDWLTWRLCGRTDVAELCTDRSDASGTGYWSPADETYREDLVELACGRRPRLPQVLGPRTPAGSLPGCTTLVAPGAGDNAAAALGCAVRTGDVLISLGTSGVAATPSDTSPADSTGIVAGFADATGRYLPLVCTLNATRVFDAMARMLGVTPHGLGELALTAPPGAEGVVVVPYWEGERTPDRPLSTGAVHGLRLDNSTPANLARAAFEGVLCGLADGVDALREQGHPIERATLIGGGTRSNAVPAIAAEVFALPIAVPAQPEVVAHGAARQAAWALSGATEPPNWTVADRVRVPASPAPAVRDQYSHARELTIRRPHHKARAASEGGNQTG
jgi:xylulokinase